MAFFSPRARAESGVSAASTPGLFLFPLIQAAGEQAEKEKVSFEAVFLTGLNVSAIISETLMFTRWSPD